MAFNQVHTVEPVKKRRKRHLPVKVEALMPLNRKSSRIMAFNRNNSGFNAV